MLSAVNEKTRAALDWVFIIAGLGQFVFYVYLGWLGVSLSTDAIPAVFILFIIVGALVGRRLGHFGRPRILICALIGGFVGGTLSAGGLIPFLPFLGAGIGAWYGYWEFVEVGEEAVDRSDIDNREDREQN